MTPSIPELPDNWFNLFGLVMINVVGLVTIWIKARDTKREMSEVREHVSNAHKTNLRDDIDAIRDRIADLGRDVSGLRDDVGQVRGEARKDRKHYAERLDCLDSKLDKLSAHHDRYHGRGSE